MFIDSIFICIIFFGLAQKFSIFYIVSIFTAQIVIAKIETPIKIEAKIIQLLLYLGSFELYAILKKIKIRKIKIINHSIQLWYLVLVRQL